MQSVGSLMSTRCQHHCVSLASPQNPRNKLLYCRQTGKRILLLYERQRLPLESTQLQRNSRARTLESDKFVIACKNVSMKKITLLRTWRRVLLDNSSSSQAFFWNLGTGTTPTASFLSSRRLFTPGNKTVLKIFFGKVTRAHMRRSSWLPLCALRFYEVYPFFSPCQRLASVVVEERDSVEGDPILRIVHIWTPVNNTSIRHCASLKPRNKLVKIFFWENSPFLKWRHGLTRTKASLGFITRSTLMGVAQAGSLNRSFRVKTGRNAKKTIWAVMYAS